MKVYKADKVTFFNIPCVVSLKPDLKGIGKKKYRMFRTVMKRLFVGWIRGGGGGCRY